MRHATALPVVESVTSPRTLVPSAAPGAGRTSEATAARANADRGESTRIGLPQISWRIGSPRERIGTGLLYRNIRSPEAELAVRRVVGFYPDSGRPPSTHIHTGVARTPG